MKNTIKATVVALGALVIMAPAANAGHMKGDCFQAMADAIKGKMAHLDAKIDAMHAWKMSKHAAAPAPAAAPKKAAPKKVAAKPMK